MFPVLSGAFCMLLTVLSFVAVSVNVRALSGDMRPPAGIGIS